MTKAQQAERQQAIADLRALLKPGDTVYTVLDHVSRSGMSRAIRVLVPAKNPDGTIARHGDEIAFLHPNYKVGIALGLRHWRRHGREQDALVVGGCGMDMGFHLVYELASVLYGREGYACLGPGKCPSPYHTNHRDRVRCVGVYDVATDRRQHCYKPSPFSRHPVPDDWPTGPERTVDLEENPARDARLTELAALHPDWDDRALIDQVNIEAIDRPELRYTVTIPGPLLACIQTPADDGSDGYVVCPTCQGAGDVPNPDGPERWDLVHTDGYALRHRWL